MRAATPWFVGPLHVSLYLVLSVVWMLFLGSAIGLALALGGDSTPDGLDIASMEPRWVAVLTSMQTGGLGLLAMLLTLLLPTQDPLFDVPARHELWPRLSDGLAAVGAPPRWLAAAVVTGGTVGFVAGALAERLEPWLPPSSADSLELLEQLFSSATGLDFILLVGATCVVAPIVEELIFRGHLWSALQRSMSPGLVLFTTTLLFASYHVYPLQALALLPTSLILGWLRWRSGSLVPPILAHAVNNALAAAGATYGGDSAPTGLTVLASAVVLLLVVTTEVWMQRGRSS